MQQRAEFEANRLAKTDGQGRISGSQRFSQIAQIVDLAQLVGRGRQHAGDGRHQPTLFIAYESLYRPRELAEGLQETFEGRLVLASKPACAQHQASEQFAHAPELRFAAFGSETIKGDHQPTVLGCGQGQALGLETLVTGEQG
jgi:hypothetical protein